MYQSKEEKILKSKRGITLIALVISIIVLLILAGVSIAMLTGENGILKKAGEASEKTKIVTEEEQRELARYEATMNLENMEYEDAKGEKAIIPAGFAPTRIEGESLISEGLVITDSEGNEFVWIPCEYTESEKNVNEDIVIYNVNTENKDNRDDEWKEKQWWYNGGTWYDEQPHTIGKNSIQKYHGFYVARYEAGVPKEAEFYVSENMTGEKLNYQKEEAKNAIDKIAKLAPVSKKGNQVWNYISQTNAKTVSENMVNNSSAKSYLIDSHAWNTICRVIQKKYSDGVSKVTNSTKWGNYLDNMTTKYEKLKGLWTIQTYFTDGNVWKPDFKYSNGTIPSKEIIINGGNKSLELATGICEDFKIYNIYDLAGNVMEWTTEVGDIPIDNYQDSENTTFYEEKGNINRKHSCSELWWKFS